MDLLKQSDVFFKTGSTFWKELKGSADELEVLSKLSSELRGKVFSLIYDSVKSDPIIHENVLLATKYTFRYKSGDRLSRILTTIPKKEIKIDFIDKIDDDERYLRGWDFRKLSSLDKEKYNKQFKNLNFIGGSESVTTTVLTLMIALGEKAMTNPFMNYLSYYVDWFIKQGGDFLEIRGAAAVDDNIFDVLYLKKVLLLCNYAYLYEMFEIPHYRVILDETCKYVFNDIDYKLKKIKSYNGWFQFFGSASQKGEIFEWEAEDYAKPRQMLTRFKHKHVDDEKYSDLKYFLAIKDDLMKDAGTVEIGLENFCKACFEMPNMNFTRENQQFRQAMETILMVGGYTRTERSISGVRQVTPSIERPSNPPYAPFLVKRWSDLLLQVDVDTNRKKNIGWMSLEDYKRLVPTTMTTRASGDTSDKVEIKFPLVRIGTSFLKSWSSNAKIAVFFADPDRWIKHALSMKDLLTKDNPGQVGTRDTVGRDSRLIYLGRLASFMLEVFFALPLYTAIERKGDRVQGSGVFSVSEFTNPEANFIGLMRATCDPYVATICTDYTKFDTQQGYVNMRKYMLDAFTEYFNGKKIDVVDFVAIMKYLTGKNIRYDANYKLPNGDIISLDLLLSGEFMTLLINCITNHALYLYFMEILSKTRLRHKFTFKSLYILGDDSVAVLETSSPGVVDIYNFLHGLVDAARSNGFEVSPSKTMFRKMAMTYLQITSMYGSFSKRALVQPFVAERRSFDPDPYPILLSKRGKMQTIAARIGKPEFLMRLWFANYLMKANVRIYDEDYKKVEREVLHFEYIYSLLPISMKGYGWFPGSLASGNVDYSIIIRYSKVLNYFNVAYESMRKRREIKNQEIAKEIFSSKFYDEGIRQSKKYLDDSRLSSSEKAINFLKRRGISINRYAYKQTFHRLLGTAISSSGESRKVAANYYNRGMSTVVEYLLANNGKFNNIPQHTENMFGWLAVIELIEKDEIKETNEGLPFIGLQEQYLRVVNTLGHIKDRGFNILKISDVLWLLKNDRLFPRDITQEALAEILSPAKIAYNPENITAVLKAMGAEPTIAQYIGQTFIANGAQLDPSVISALSYGGGIAQACDLTIDNLKRFITMNMYLSPKHTNLIYSVIGQFLLVRLMQGNVGKHIEVKYISQEAAFAAAKFLKDNNKDFVMQWFEASKTMYSGFNAIVPNHNVVRPDQQL